MKDGVDRKDSFERECWRVTDGDGVYVSISPSIPEMCVEGWERGVSVVKHYVKSSEPLKPRYRRSAMCFCVRHETKGQIYEMESERSSRAS